MADDAPGPSGAVERCNFESAAATGAGAEQPVGAARSSAAAAASRGQLQQPDETQPPFGRPHQRRHGGAAKSPWVANDDRRAESPTQWEDVEEARAARVRKASARRTASGSRSSPAAQQPAHHHSSRGLADARGTPPVPRKPSSTLSERSSSGGGGSTGCPPAPATPRTPAEAGGGGDGGRASADARVLKSSDAAQPQHWDRAHPHASRRSGSGVDLGASPAAARRSVRHRHSSLLRRADALSQLSNQSLVSVFSSLTHSSSGSNSTVTQKSYDRSHGIRKRRHSSKHHDDHHHHHHRGSTRADGQGSAGLGERATRRRRRSSQPPPAAHHAAEPGPSEFPPAEAASLPGGDCSARPPAAVARDRVNSDSGISVRDSSPEGTGRGPRMDGKAAAAASLPWDPQDDEDEEDKQRQLAINRLYRELAAQDPHALESVGEDRMLQKLLDQEEQLRLHMLRSPTHHHARDEPLYSHNDDADSPRGPAAFPYYYYHGSPSQPQPGPYWGRSDPPPPPPAPHVPSPDPGYHAAASPYGQYAPSSPHGRGNGQLQSSQPDRTGTTITGYEKLASTLAERSLLHDDGESDAKHRQAIRPLYRRFEYLNHRILLHIQDELSEMEEELRVLDECIAQQQGAVAGQEGKAPPASRRLEGRFGTDLHTRRTLMLGSIYVKLGQYSSVSLLRRSRVALSPRLTLATDSAMTSFGKMLSVLEPAKADEVSAYESWIREHEPIAESETRFLTHQADLMSFSRRHRRAAQMQEQSTLGAHGIDILQMTMLALPLFLALPLIAFPQIPGMGGRVFILAVIGAAEVAMVSSTRLACLMSAMEWGICSIAYFVLMTVIATVV